MFTVDVKQQINNNNQNTNSFFQNSISLPRFSFCLLNFFFFQFSKYHFIPSKYYFVPTHYVFVPSYNISFPEYSSFPNIAFSFSCNTSRLLSVIISFSQKDIPLHHYFAHAIKNSFPYYNISCLQISILFQCKRFPFFAKTSVEDKNIKQPGPLANWFII